MPIGIKIKQKKKARLLKLKGIKNFLAKQQRVMEVVKTFNFDIENNIMIVNNVKITVVGNYETPWFSGKEMCEALGYQNSKKTLLINVKTKHKITLEDLQKLGPSGGPNFLWFTDPSYHEGKAVYISEHGAYHLAMKCKLPIGDSFRDWLAEEVGNKIF